MVTASPLLFVNAVLSSSIGAAALFRHNRASAWSITPFDISPLMMLITSTVFANPIPLGDIP
jgi:hypothetical protein